MKKEYSKHETDYIAEYQSNGYTTNFIFQNNCLVDVDTKYGYKPEEIFIVAHHRYEGMSNPEDMSILYIIETANQVKGTYLLGYGPTGDLEASEFFKDIPKENYAKNSDVEKNT
jgi:hypothetical protein